MPTIDEKLENMIGKKTSKPCPDCGAIMVVRKNRQNGSFFLGCNDFPTCKRTMPIPEDMKMELMGFATLPGFGSALKPQDNQRPDKSDPFNSHRIWDEADDV